jgi:hypothetical protein
VTHRLGLGRVAAASDGRDDVVLLEELEELERLPHDHLVGLADEVLVAARPLTVIVPVPGLIQTRATAVLRLPVA